MTDAASDAASAAAPDRAAGGQPEVVAARSGGADEGDAGRPGLVPEQRPWAQPTMRLRPTEVVSEDELESIHLASLRILRDIGMDFLDAEARRLLKDAGATVDGDGPRVRFDPDMVLERITTAPSTFRLHAWNPAHTLEIGGPHMAFGSVASAPNVSDMDGGRRVGNRADYQNLLRLTQHFNIVHFLAGYPVEPIDIHASVRHLDATFDELTLCDKALHAYSLGRQRNIDCLELVRIARQVDDETLEREPSIFTVINSSSPLRLGRADAPGHPGVLAETRSSS